MFTRLYQQVPLLNRLPPWAVALGAAFTLILAGTGQGLVQGQATAKINQALTIQSASTQDNAPQDGVIAGDRGLLTGGTAVLGIISDGNTKFLVQVTMEQGEAALINMTLNNKSDQVAVARVVVTGAPAGLEVIGAIGASGKVLAVLRETPTSFLITVVTATATDTASNFQLQLLARDNAPVGTVSLTITLQQVQN